MRVSENEILKTCEKAFRGAGYPSGLFEDAAAAAAWLEMRGLGGVALALTALEGAAGPRGLKASGGRIEAGGASAFAVGPAAVDLAFARRGAALLIDCAGPLAIAPMLAARASPVGPMRARWRSGGGKVEVVASGPEAVWIAGSAPLLAAPEPVEIDIACDAPGAPGGVALDGGDQVLARPRELAAMAADARASGAAVNDDLWARLKEAARASFTPASAASRAHGAGWTGGDGE